MTKIKREFQKVIKFDELKAGDFFAIQPDYDFSVYVKTEAFNVDYIEINAVNVESGKPCLICSDKEVIPVREVVLR